MDKHRFIITGGQPLRGQIRVGGSKNAALPIIAAALLTDEPVTLSNVPNIADVYTLQHILHFLGVKTEFEGDKIAIHAPQVANLEIEHELVSKLRASILFLAPLLARNGQVRLAYPGGCLLGKRPVDAHLEALKALGAQVKLDPELITIEGKLKGADFTMVEASVTGTENAIMASVLASGITTIRFAACEPHVQDLCHFLVSMGAKIKGIGTHTLEIEGVKKLHGTDYRITSDYLEAGTLVLAAAITQGEVEVQDLVPHHLDIFWQKLREVGVHFELGKDHVKVFPSKAKYQGIRLQTAIYPSFPSDLQAPFATLLTQAQGKSFIFETLFEGRLQYLYELEKMGLKSKILNAHQAEFEGPVKLRGASVASCDLRAGAAVVLAALAAAGKTEVSDVYYIDRGYDKLDLKLNSLGAQIQRVLK